MPDSGAAEPPATPGVGYQPPAFVGDGVGTRLQELPECSAPWVVGRAITAPALTRQLMVAAPEFVGLGDHDLTTAANTMTFHLVHLHRWVRLWVESVPYAGEFSHEMRTHMGVSEETTRELTTAVGVTLGGSLWVANAEASARWSRFTRSSVTINEENEFTRTLTFAIPEGGMDIALWQLESTLLRKLQLRRDQSLPMGQQPRWVEAAVTTPLRRATVRCNMIMTTARSRAGTHEPRRLPPGVSAKATSPA